MMYGYFWVYGPQSCKAKEGPGARGSSRLFGRPWASGAEGRCAPPRPSAGGPRQGLLCFCGCFFGDVDGDVDVEVDVDTDSYSWLFEGGFKISSGTA